ncbi:MAG: glycosyltransferase [Methylophilaceae bacterium]
MQITSAVTALLTCFVYGAAVCWVSLLLVPWRPWSTCERLDATAATPAADLSDITVLIPARDEAEVIAQTLTSLAAQGRLLNILLIDDQSTDGTAAIARAISGINLTVINGAPLTPGWSGKLWALEQGRRHIKTPLTLLLDADIALEPGLLFALREKMQTKHIQFASLMAALRMQSFWEKLLMPAFIYFFKLLYPFKLSNKPWRGSLQPRVAAAAGGCILLETRILAEMGGFGALREALIDDCTLARKVKTLGYRTWVGLTHSVISLRPYPNLQSIWQMVTRTAFTQLHYSVPLLLLCTLMMTMTFWAPVAGLLLNGYAAIASVLALAAMLLSYIPTLRFYRLSIFWALAMPIIGTLFLAMTWASALSYYSGKRSQWKGRTYSKTLDTD